ncbi:MAG: leucine-rich repeat domain-containing protein [Verrucomicrobia bacterium]|nr:leucine-rich repeat domain-containing protein [Verrucomicrobiota bacterium]
MAAFPPSSINPNQTFIFPKDLRLATLAAQVPQPDDMKFADSTYRLFEWNRLKTDAPSGPLNLPEIMAQVEQEVVKETGALAGNVNELFQRFAEKLRPDFEATCSTEEAFGMSQLHLTALQARLQVHYENQALETIWNQGLLPIFTQRGAFENIVAPVGVPAIREWLNDPENAQRIQEVRTLYLSSLNLKVLPSEIKLFLGLEELILDNNQLTVLPESIGDLQSLLILNLSNNHLSSLPNSFQCLGQIENLHLFNNKLRVLPDWFGKFQDLETLDLHNNLLRDLPESIGDLEGLQELYLGYNELSDLPESIRGLSSLWRLDLQNNQLTNLPYSIVDLKALQELYLNDNQLTALPEEFGNLTNLEIFDYSGNPLMLIFDKEEISIDGSEAYAVRLNELKKYTPQSPLAILFKTIGFNKPVETVQKAYQGLSFEMQQRIVASTQNRSTEQETASSSFASSTSSSSSSSSSESHVDLFADMGLFARSVRQAAYDLYDSLGQEQKDLVHHHIWDLAGRPETDDPNWGGNHVFDHVLRFTDALERATRQEVT